MNCSSVSIASSRNMHVLFSPVNRFLSFSGKQFILALYKIYNSSLVNGVFPDIWN